MALKDSLDDLLGDKQTGNRRDDLVAAAKESLRRREHNTRVGAEVISAMISDGLSYREIETLTGIPRSTAQRWATPPSQA